MTADNSPKLYIAGMGMVTPVGGNVVMTAAAVNAGISAYGASDFNNNNGHPVTMALLPKHVLSQMIVDIDDGNRYNEQHDRIIRMAILSLREACANQKINEPIPLLLAMPDVHRDYTDLASLPHNLAKNCSPMVAAALTRSIHSGRAAGIEAIDFAFNYLLSSPQDFILVGGSDSHFDDVTLSRLDNDKRLLSPDNPNGFAPGESAAFLLLTRHAELAQVRNGKIIALHKPGIAEERGHLHSKETYRGDGLDRALKNTFELYTKKNISAIYSSMNGENYWAKELGVARIRNQQHISENVTIKHPSDSIGDVGAATAPILIALATEDLFKQKTAFAHLVYASSDSAKRGAIVLEKITAVTELGVNDDTDR